MWARLIVALLPVLPRAGTPMAATEAPEGNTLTWRMVGPGGGGWIQAIAYDPQDPNRLYVGCDVGGFYVSFDGGRHFTIRNRGLRNYFVEAIAVSPRGSQVLLLGTEGGIFRSTDQGRTWQWMREGFPAVQRYGFSAPIGALCFDPQQPRVVYAGVGRPRFSEGGCGAIYRSDDAGLTWREVARGQLPADAIVSDLEVKPDDSRVILAATSRGVFRSADGGRTWRLSSAGLPHLYVEELAFAPSAPHVVYLTLRTTARDAEPWNGGVYRSDDGGLTWQARNAGLPTQVGKRNESPYMTSNCKEIVVDPRDADVVYVGDRAWVSAGVYKSVDGGRHWTRATVHWGQGLNMDYGWLRQWGPSVECLAICPAAPHRLAFGTSGHVFVTENAGRSWQQRYCQVLPDGRFSGNGLEVTCVNDVVPDPVRPDRLYFCYADIGLLISDDRGQTFRRSYQGMRHEGNTFTVVIDPQAPNILWAATGQWASNHGDVCRSDDGGQTWQVVGQPESGLPDGQVKHLLLDLRSPVGKRRLLATVSGYGVYESTDGGTTWRCRNGNLSPEVARNPRGLLLDPADPHHLLLAAGGSVAKGAGVYETHDAGSTWQRLGAELNVGEIQSLAADPHRFRTLYLAARELYDRQVTPPVLRPGGVFKSTDGGATWQHILDYHFVLQIAVNPADPNTLYAATTDHPYHDDYRAEGVLKSRDGGLTWRKENTGLSLLNASCLRIDPRRPWLLYLGTGGNSAFLGLDRELEAARARLGGRHRAPREPGQGGR
jgi:photosystem II stability/assembly factor-like uncharacterized protein